MERSDITIKKIEAILSLFDESKGMPSTIVINQHKAKVEPVISNEYIDLNKYMDVRLLLVEIKKTIEDYRSIKSALRR